MLKKYSGDDNSRQIVFNLLKCDLKYENRTTQKKKAKIKYKVQDQCQLWKKKKYNAEEENPSQLWLN